MPNKCFRAGCRARFSKENQNKMFEMYICKELCCCSQNLAGVVPAEKRARGRTRWDWLFWKLCFACFANNIRPHGEQVKWEFRQSASRGSVSNRRFQIMGSQPTGSCHNLQLEKEIKTWESASLSFDVFNIVINTFCIKQSPKTR